MVQILHLDDMRELLKKGEEKVKEEKNINLLCCWCITTHTLLNNHSK